MGGKNYNQKSIDRERQNAAFERAAITEFGGSVLARLPGHLVEVKGMGTYTAVNVDYGAGIVYCWRESEPGQVLPVPFSRVFVPFKLEPGKVPPGM
jgi:hypothetical protein